MNQSSFRILAVDDHPDNLLLLRNGLRQLGYLNCETETSPVQAVVRFYDEDFDLVLLDYNMPIMNGLDVMEAIAEKAKREEIPVVVITAHSDRETRLKILKAGAKDFLSQPIDMVELSVRIQNLLATRNLHLQLRQHNEQLEQIVLRRTEELHSTRLDIIRRLVRATEFRDPKNAIHVQRMTLYSVAIARKMALGEFTLDLLQDACPLHDLGEIGVSDLILLKPGKLTAEEFARMQAHTTIGASVLAGHDSDLLSVACDIARHHHERWDGTGYPDGLAGEAIPLCARIAAVADVFEALTINRPYRPAWHPDDARREILSLSAVQFDPTVVTAFDACYDAILAIRDLHPDL